MNKISEIKTIDVFEQYEAAKDIINSFLTSYKNQNSWKIRLLDSYVVFCFIIFVVTFVYVILNGLYPMNAILASLICSLGSMILAGKNIQIFLFEIALVLEKLFIFESFNNSFLKISNKSHFEDR